MDVNKRVRTVTFRLLEHEYAELAAAAAEGGVTVSDQIRRAIRASCTGLAPAHYVPTTHVIAGQMFVDDSGRITG